MVVRIPRYLCWLLFFVELFVRGTRLIWLLLLLFSVLTSLIILLSGSDDTILGGRLRSFCVGRRSTVDS
jgi:hypothetical protein